MMIENSEALILTIFNGCILQLKYTRHTTPVTSRFNLP